MNSLEQNFIKKLKQSAHHLNPVVIIGQKGLTPAVLAEIQQSILAHELIKIKLNIDNKLERDELINEIATQLNIYPIQHIGKIAIFWQKNKKKDN